MDSGKRTFNSDRGSRRILVTALVLSLALPLTSMVSSLPAAYASTSIAIKGTGTFEDTSVTITSIQMVGSNEVIKDWGVGKVTGTLTGTYYFAATITVTPSGVATYSAIDGCQCIIAGKAGGLVFSELGLGDVATGSFQSKATITQSSDGLKGITGIAVLQGIQNPVTMLTSGTYTISLSKPQYTQTSGVSYSPQGSAPITSPASGDAQRSLAPSAVRADASQTPSSGADGSHALVNHAAPVSSHSQAKHASDTQPPTKSAAPTSNTHVDPSHPHRSP